MFTSRTLERLDYEVDEGFQVYLHKRRYELARKYLDEGTLLDIGCGFGYGTNFLSFAHNSAIGIDISVDALLLARSRYTTPVFARADATGLPFKDQSFDTVVAMEVIEHITNQEAFMSEVLRVLTQHGMLILSTPNKKNLIARIASFLGVEVQKNPYHTKEFDYNELTRFLTSHRLKVLHRFGVYLPLFPPIGGMTRLMELTRAYKPLTNAGAVVSPLARFTFVVCKKL